MAARAASFSLVAVFLLFSKTQGGASRKDLPFIILAGVFDSLGNLFFALAANLGRLDVSAVPGRPLPRGHGSPGLDHPQGTAPENSSGRGFFRRPWGWSSFRSETNRRQHPRDRRRPPNSLFFGPKRKPPLSGAANDP